MQKIKYILILSLVLLQVGCIKDDLDDCPNLYLNFSYLAGNKEKSITDYIHSAQLYIYDSQQQLVSVQQLHEQAILSGVGLKLSPDTYTAIAWANVSELSSITQMQNATTALLTTQKDKEGVYSSTDPLYLGSHTFDVTAQSDFSEPVYETVDFRSAHLSLDITIKGLGNELATVSVENLIPQYDFSMKPMKPNDINYSPRVNLSEDEKQQKAFLHVLRYKGKQPMELTITPSSEGSIPYTLDMREFVNEYYPDLSLANRADITIRIEIEFSGLDVIATIPDWTITDGTGEIE